jgi:asparagine synthase (glutamine-hydrolysing)
MGDAVLGHRRLAIFDLSPAGHQPMLLGDDLALVFNGAIYNFPALRDELQRAGAQFRSRTDTEVLLWGYREWGIDALVERLRGMFAFALWDNRRGSLLLVRDRLGVKPLYFREAGGSIAFASTADAIHDGGWGADVDADAIGDFLENGYISDTRCIYRGVRKVPAATIIEWHGGATTERRYWAPPKPGTHKLSFSEAVEETERLLLAATERRLHADVPVGALLSGGVDSALVCWAVRKLGGDVTAFTVATPGHEADESSAAALTASELGIAHQTLSLSEAGPPDVGALSAAYGEPFAASSALGMLTVSGAVATARVKVLLTGDGGDDVFLGYDRHRLLARLQRVAGWLPAGVGPAWRQVRGVMPNRGPLRRAGRLLDYVTGGVGAFLSGSDGLPGYRASGLLGTKLDGVAIPARAIPQSVDRARSILSDYLEHDLRHQFVGEYLTKVDGATMYHALEARAPFLDQDLWEFAAGLPFEVRLHEGRLKAVLRELAARRISPRVARERKRGFTIPVTSWISGAWHAEVATALRASPLVAQGWINGPALAADLERARHDDIAGLRIWYLFVLDAWWRQRQPG